MPTKTRPNHKELIEHNLAVFLMNYNHNIILRDAAMNEGVTITPTVVASYRQNVSDYRIKYQTTRYIANQLWDSVDYEAVSAKALSLLNQQLRATGRKELDELPALP